MPFQTEGILGGGMRPRKRVAVTRSRVFGRQPGSGESGQQRVVAELVQGRGAGEELQPFGARHAGLVLEWPLRVAAGDRDLDPPQAAGCDLRQGELGGLRDIGIDGEEHGLSGELAGDGVRRDGFGEYAGVKELGLVAAEDDGAGELQSGVQIAAQGPNRGVQQRRLRRAAGWGDYEELRGGARAAAP